ncbi:tRNA (adenosine(37)-N6)-threonylcarbamoyltransferase complex dimerization subunit type 1 TsaB [Pseudonocardia sp. KRD291]|uniref:tRNA (adenosine(37)-N6)-threonylcarbamoyltransferase complex dimerization subunit type 1 TsaB n=1 Tax=Pseudonocardia sp. KRD291 TaxID=2792007 RepID=UPI001C4A6C8F|nr:tRNA (adenosine(37)-N6)-threonylcarbamoyltransferase complex dimerization subunit type 1 TsaB [Pseudonocardia sp. KRD291]MBW0106663.1 tRNA (adenosine(37)-N6)-threonylcarbamoyltransferase complex dimerization subunit type 1 TsaB [Pseudonocardia sp. KRD291]
MLVLALDTATPVVTAGLVDLPADGSWPSVRAARAHDGRKHGELLMPAVLEIVAEAAVVLADVEAVVVGCGPGPFTGLRVGIVSAAALGDALGVPVHGVCSLDAVALAAAGRFTLSGEPGTSDGAAPRDAAGPPGNLLVVTDARRRETYWAVYDPAGRRLTGPSVEAPEQLRERLPELFVGRAAGDAAFAERLDLEIDGPASPPPDGLVAAASGALLAGTEPAPLEPLYLRRPDAVEPTGRKRVTA